MRGWHLIVVAEMLLVAPAAHAQDAQSAGTYSVTLPPRTFQAVVTYRKRQPWEDVQPLMAALAQAAQASLPQPPAQQKQAPIEHDPK